MYLDLGVYPAFVQYHKCRAENIREIVKNHVEICS